MNAAIRLPQPLTVLTTEKGLEITLPITQELIFFPGHFPVRAILPGVVMIDWVIELAEKYLSLRVKIPLQMEVIKFKQPVIAGDDVSITLNLNYLEAKGKLVFSLYGDKGECSSGRIVIDANSRYTGGR